MIFAPITDISESRYAEISRKMVETGDWITPQIAYGVPFWAKPPLSMWMSAAGMELFGANEFGSRIFIFLAAMVILALVAEAVRRESDSFTALAAVTLLMGMPLFFYCSAAVMTDMALALGTTLAMVSFRLAVRENSRRWGYAFFLGLAIGLLAKGPLALVLALPPVAGWTLLTGNWRRTWSSVPWFTGTLVMLGLSAPWYFAAELKTPGFIQYFIVGEHWKRFVESGWKGDLYGQAHSETPGMIWVYLLMITFPWCLGLFAVPIRKWREVTPRVLANDGQTLYWLLWALWPIVFFTPARNIIATYPLPALPALAILLAGLVRRAAGDEIQWRKFHPLHPAFIIVCLALTLISSGASIFAVDRLPKKTERRLTQLFQKQSRDGDRLAYYRSRSYSADFYSGGVAEHVSSPEAVSELLDTPGRLFLAMSDRAFLKLPPNIQRHFVKLTSRGEKQSELYREREDTPLLSGIDPTMTHAIGN